jgi:predicted nucleic-acid-binding protein
MTLVDTNIILRYLMNDHPEMSAKARDILRNNPTLILTQVVAETVYVLGGVYKTPRPEISAALRSVFSLPNAELENGEIVSLAVDEYGTSKLDFVDLLLFAHHQITGLDVETFDRGLLKKLATIKESDA